MKKQKSVHKCDAVIAIKQTRCLSVNFRLLAFFRSDRMVHRILDSMSAFVFMESFTPVLIREEVCIHKLLVGLILAAFKQLKANVAEKNSRGIPVKVDFNRIAFF